MATKIESEEEKRARETVEAIAKNIEDLARGVRAILNGRLTEKAIILLLASAAGGMPQETVKKVLEACASLDKKFLR